MLHRQQNKSHGHPYKIKGLKLLEETSLRKNNYIKTANISYPVDNITFLNTYLLESDLFSVQHYPTVE